MTGRERVRSVVDSQLAAYNEGDVDAFVDHFHEDVAMTELSSGEVTASGRDAVRDQYGDLFDAYPDLRCEFRDRLTVGPFDACHEAITGMDEPMDALAIYEVRDGTIRRLWLGHW